MAEKIICNVSRKEVVMVALFAILLGWYVVYGTSCFRTYPIRIEHSVRPSAASPQVVYVTSFAFDREYPLTAIKVFRLQDLPANEKTLPLWHLVGKTAPTRSLVYGSALSGLTPYLSGATARPLEPNVTYRIFVEAGHLRGEHDFTIPAQAVAR